MLPHALIVNFSAPARFFDLVGLQYVMPSSNQVSVT